VLDQISKPGGSKSSIAKKVLRETCGLKYGAKPQLPARFSPRHYPNWKLISSPELKATSPSLGVIRILPDPVRTRHFVRSGWRAALSFLTKRILQWLSKESPRRAQKDPDQVLRKDFMFGREVLGKPAP